MLSPAWPREHVKIVQHAYAEAAKACHRLT